MFQKSRLVLTTIISGLFLMACANTETDIPTITSVIQEEPASTPKPTQVTTLYPVPNHSYNIEEENDVLTFENGSPIPVITTFYKNQLLASGCKLYSESGSSMDAIMMVFKDCEQVDALRIVIFANPRNSGSVVSIAPDS